MVPGQNYLNSDLIKIQCELSGIFIIIFIINLNAILNVIYYSDFSINAILAHA